MWQKIRPALIWLMVLATPIQGFAAATMLYCGPGHHNAAGSHELPALAGQADEGTTGHAHHHDHAAHAHEEDATPAATPGQVSAADALDQSAKIKCSVCASCCSVAVIASSVVAIPVVTPVSAPLITVPASPISFITDGPSRPPRTFLA